MDIPFFCRFALVALVAGLSACEQPSGTGEVRFRGASDFDSFNPFVLDDGWTVEFDGLYGVVTDLEVVDLGTGELLANDPRGIRVDFTDGGSNTFGSELEVSAGRVGIGFRTTTPQGAEVGLFPEEIQTLMVDEGFVLYVVGRAILPSVGDSVDFAWGIPAPTTFSDCVNGDDGEEGVRVVEDEQVDAAITLRSRQLFATNADDAASSTQFQAFDDADTDGDGEITTSELLSVTAADVGLTSAEPDATLYRYVVLAMSDALFLNGAGRCVATDTP